MFYYENIGRMFSVYIFPKVIVANRGCASFLLEHGLIQGRRCNCKNNEIARWEIFRLITGFPGFKWKGCMHVSVGKIGVRLRSFGAKSIGLWLNVFFAAWYFPVLIPNNKLTLIDCLMPKTFSTETYWYEHYFRQNESCEYSGALDSVVIGLGSLKSAFVSHSDFLLFVQKLVIENMSWSSALWNQAPTINPLPCKEILTH